MAFWFGAPDEFKLLILTENRDINEIFLYRMNPETGDTLTGIALTHPEDLRMDTGGISIADRLGENGPVLLHLCQDGPDDRIDIRALHGTLGWLYPSSYQGRINANESETVELLFDTRGFEPDFYESYIRIEHDLLSPPVDILTQMQVVNSVTDADRELLPTSPQITATYPNPFNSTVTVDYALPVSGNLSLQVYDLAGRLVEQLYSGKADAGRHSLTWQADSYSTGMYLLRMEASGVSQTQKLMLLK